MYYDHVVIVLERRMKTVPVVEVKAKLSALLAEVARGEEIAITRHGRIVARLVPDRPTMASEAFRTFWNDEEIDLEAPEDLPAEPVLPLD
ncbi:MAG: type II toxin-antitoxin system prevent-host-death family antitoxin [Burkholderiaceae bacterium]|nr:type II toxin-antitoxin system prevent-host-death family antitoxin [Burkholderiaceae bacterium]